MTGMFVELLKQSVDMIRLRDAIVKKKIVINLSSDLTLRITTTNSVVEHLHKHHNDERQSLYRTLHLIYFI